MQGDVHRCQRVQRPAQAKANSFIYCSERRQYYIPQRLTLADMIQIDKLFSIKILLSNMFNIEPIIVIL